MLKQAIHTISRISIHIICGNKAPNHFTQPKPARQKEKPEDRLHGSSSGGSPTSDLRSDVDLGGDVRRICCPALLRPRMVRRTGHRKGRRPKPGVCETNADSCGCVWVLVLQIWPMAFPKQSCFVKKMLRYLVS